MTSDEQIQGFIDNSEYLKTVYANTYTYKLYKGKDGWISVFRLSELGNYIPIIQAKDLQHAETFIYLREPAPAGIDILE